MTWLLLGLQCWEMIFESDGAGTTRENAWLFRCCTVVQPHAFPSSMQLNGRKKSKQDNNELEKKWKQMKNGKAYKALQVETAFLIQTRKPIVKSHDHRPMGLALT